VSGRRRQQKSGREIHSQGDAWWPLAMARELDDAILMLRTNETELGLILFKTEGDWRRCLANDVLMMEHGRLAGARDDRNVTADVLRGWM